MFGLQVLKNHANFILSATRYRRKKGAVHPKFMVPNGRGISGMKNPERCISKMFCRKKDAGIYRKSSLFC